MQSESLNSSNVIKIIIKFLNPEVTKDKESLTIEDILNFSLDSYKFLDKKQANLLKKIWDVNRISEAAKLEDEESFKTFMGSDKPKSSQDFVDLFGKKIRNFDKKYPDFHKEYSQFEQNVKKANIISKIIVNLSNKKEKSFSEVLGTDKQHQKVIVAGLDNAGKTAIISKFGGELGVTDLKNLKPTKGVNRKRIESEKIDLFIWDLGGQEESRNKYIEYPEQYFLQLDLFIYVLDVQDSERFEESYDYLDKLLEILLKLEENPYILIFIHKHDPDIKHKPEILLNVEFLKENIQELIQSKNYNFNYEIYLTSIFSSITREPKFSRHIKNLMKNNYALNDPAIKKIEGLGKIIEDTLNAVIHLSESISKQLSNIESRLRAIESGAFQIAQSGTPIEISNMQTSTPESAGDARSTVLSELKDLFAKKKNLEL
ncbi:MAG: hypothetical protein GF353_23075 [Candidatus Lokiarchaeota archaeon]|nr:hypothetical protein [Candidatus Lokiarchaeota archaeon]